MQETSTLKLGDKEYSISLGMNEWVEFEKLSGKNALMDDVFTNMSMTGVLCLVYSCLKYSEGCNLTMDQCSNLIGNHNLMDISKILMELSVAGMPSKKDDDAKKK